MDGASSWLDPCTSPNDYQISYASYKASQQTKLKSELMFLVYHVFFGDNSSLKCAKKNTLHNHIPDLT